MDEIRRRGLAEAIEMLALPAVGLIVAVAACWAIFRGIAWLRSLPGSRERFAIFRRMMAIQCCIAGSFFAGMFLSLPTIGFFVQAVFGNEILEIFGLGIAAVVTTVVMLSILGSAVAVGLMTMIAVAWALWDLLPPVRRD